MRKRTLIVISALVLAVLLVGSGMAIGYVYFNGNIADDNVPLNAMSTTSDGNNSGADDVADKGANEESGDGSEITTDYDTNNNRNVSSAQTTTQMVSEEEMASIIDTLEAGLLSDGDDALDVLDYADMDYIRGESDNTDNILYGLYMVEQGDQEGYLATTNLSLFNMQGESEDYERINGDLTITSTNPVICLTRTDVLIEKETGNKEAELKYTIRQNPANGRLMSVEADVNGFGTGSRVNESDTDDDEPDVEYIDNAAPIQEMPPNR